MVEALKVPSSGAPGFIESLVVGVEADEILGGVVSTALQSQQGRHLTAINSSLHESFTLLSFIPVTEVSSLVVNTDHEHWGLHDRHILFFKLSKADEGVSFNVAQPSHICVSCRVGGETPHSPAILTAADKGVEWPLSRLKDGQDNTSLSLTGTDLVRHKYLERNI